VHVWIHSPNTTIAESLCVLLIGLGFRASDRLTEETKVGLWDLTHVTVSGAIPSPPDVPTVALVHPSTDLVTLLIAGYRGYVRAGEGADTLQAALRAVARGELWAERDALAQTIRRVSRPQLTAREEEIHRLISEGLTNRAVARKLGITERTVKAHASRVYEKLGVHGRVELIVRSRGAVGHT
jgi:DNA-binding NarL/FixJ family response regulator